MSKRRHGNDNWYALDYEERRILMKGHATTGRKYSGRILQLITGSTGLDDAEWGVTLLAKDTIDIKAIVYEMRFDPVSVRYGELGTSIGMQILDEIFKRLSSDQNRRSLYLPTAQGGSGSKVPLPQGPATKNPCCSSKSKKGPKRKLPPKSNPGREGPEDREHTACK